MSDTENVAAGGAGVEIKMPRHQRYYALHREEKLAKYHTNPDVIRKKEERERKKAEKEAEKEAKREAKKEELRLKKERARQEKIAIALATSKKPKTIGGGLDAILGEVSPV